MTSHPVRVAISCAFLNMPFFLFPKVMFLLLLSCMYSILIWRLGTLYLPFPLRRLEPEPAPSSSSEPLDSSAISSGGWETSVPPKSGDPVGPLGLDSTADEWAAVGNGLVGRERAGSLWHETESI